MAPSDWGTEAIAFDSSAAPLKYGQASYGDLWKPEYKGRVTVRGHSSLIGIALWLESQGKLPHPVKDQFTDESEGQRQLRRHHQGRLREQGVGRPVLVQRERGPGRLPHQRLRHRPDLGQLRRGPAARKTCPSRFVAPKEGALAWMEGFCITKGAKNLAQAYEWINWYYTPEAGALYSNHTSINTTAKGARGSSERLQQAVLRRSLSGRRAG